MGNYEHVFKYRLVVPANMNNTRVRSIESAIQMKGNGGLQNLPKVLIRNHSAHGLADTHYRILYIHLRKEVTLKRILAVLFACFSLKQVFGSANWHGKMNHFQIIL